MGSYFLLLLKKYLQQILEFPLVHITEFSNLLFICMLSCLLSRADSEELSGESLFLFASVGKAGCSVRDTHPGFIWLFIAFG